MDLIHWLLIGWTEYKLMPVIGILFFVLSFWFFLITVFKTPSKSKLLVFSFLFTVIHFAQAPSLPHDLYWMVSSFVYLYPWSFTFLWLGSYLSYIHIENDGKALLWFLLTLLLLVCCIGMNEMFLITNLVLLTWIAYWSHKKNRASFLRTAPILLVGVSAILFFITSPGISFRLDANMQSDASLFYVKGISQSVRDFGFALLSFLKNGMVLIFAFWVVLQIGEVQSRYQLMITSGSKCFAFLAIAGLILVAYLMTMAYYLPMQIDSGYPSRIFNSVVILIQFVFVIVVPLFLINNKAIATLSKLTNTYNALMMLFLVLLLVIILKLPNNIATMQREYMLGYFDDYNNNMQHRYKAIQEAKNSQKCLQVAQFDSLILPPSTIYYGPDLMPNRAKGFWNNAYENYFKLDQVKLSGDSLLF